MMIDQTTPRGLAVAVPETLDEGPTKRFNKSELVSIRKYYDEFGYVVVGGLVDPSVCDTLRGLWDGEVKPSKSFIYRQATAKAERHILNENAWVMNPILNLQSIDPKEFGKFRTFATDKVLADGGLAQIFTILLDDRPKLVQSMYFEGNSATWEHQDTYYLDSEREGKMVAAWIALESIQATAGRFFVCPRSHRIIIDNHSFKNNIADNHDVYIESVVEKIRGMGLEIRAPMLEKGDVLFWNSRTIHGSLYSQDRINSRSSVTVHAIPANSRFLQLQMRLLDVAFDEVNGVCIHRPKDLAVWSNKAVFWFESNFPSLAYTVKRAAIRRLSRRAARNDKPTNVWDDDKPTYPI